MVQAQDLLCGNSEAERRPPPALVHCDLGEWVSGSDPSRQLLISLASLQAGPVLSALKLIL